MKIETYRSPAFNLVGYVAYKVKYDDGTSGTVLEHREVYERHLGRRLRSDEVVHHKDEDKRNNSLSNLEVLTPSAHAKHHAADRALPPMRLTCILCGAAFERNARSERHNRKKGKAGPFCGRSCGAKYGYRLRERPLQGDGTGVTPHGTPSGYQYWKCRCSACRDSHRRDLIQYRKRRAERRAASPIGTRRTA